MKRKINTDFIFRLPVIFLMDGHLADLTIPLLSVFLLLLEL